VGKTQFVSYSENGFWAYDVALPIFLKHLIDAAEASDQAELPWLSEAISWWRTVACISDYGLTLGEGWSEAQQETFIALAEDACQRLANRDAIPAEEIVAWPLLEDLPIFSRGATEVATGPVVELGRAVIALVSGGLPEPPIGMAWFYGTDGGRRTLGMKLPSS
jgi:hypothetical protein